MNHLLSNPLIIRSSDPKICDYSINILLVHALAISMSTLIFLTILSSVFGSVSKYSSQRVYMILQTNSFRSRMYSGTEYKKDSVFV
jgi:hypothetical protein